MSPEEITVNTSGFYKAEDGQLFHGPNAVYNKNFTLLREDRETLPLPIDGWDWYASEEDARTALGIPAETTEEETPV